MGQLEDIERLRKKRNRRQNFKRLAVFLLILAIFFGGWIVWEKIKQTSLAAGRRFCGIGFRQRISNGNFRRYGPSDKNDGKCAVGSDGYASAYL